MRSGLHFSRCRNTKRAPIALGRAGYSRFPTSCRYRSRFFFEGAPQLAGSPAPQGGADAPSPAYVSDFLATSDGLSLTKAFMRIPDAKLRRRIVDLVQQIAGEESETPKP